MPDPPILRQRLWGRDFPNPIGIAAGFDKDARVPDALLRLGFGFVEIGTVTPRPQPGNPKPRVFRLEADGALINRLGFNSGGLDRRDRAAPARAPRGRHRRRQSRQEPRQHRCRRRLCRGCAAQPRRWPITSSSTCRRRTRRGCATCRPAPCSRRTAATVLARARRDRRAAAAAGQDRARPVARGTRRHRRGRARDRHRRHRRRQHHGGAAAGAAQPARDARAGGLSGRPLFAPSTALLGDIYRLTEGRLPLIGVGGIASAADAYAKIRAGASLVQLYTALVFRGPGAARRDQDAASPRCCAATASPRSPRRSAPTTASLRHLDTGPAAIHDGRSR